MAAAGLRPELIPAPWIFTPRPHPPAPASLEGAPGSWQPVTPVTPQRGGGGNITSDIYIYFFFFFQPLPCKRLRNRPLWAEAMKKSFRKPLAAEPCPAPIGPPILHRGAGGGSTRIPLQFSIPLLSHLRLWEQARIFQVDYLKPDFWLREEGGAGGSPWMWLGHPLPAPLGFPAGTPGLGMLEVA